MSDRLSADTIKEYAGSWWSDIAISAQTQSTNTDALLAAQNLFGEGYVFITDHQVGGRGRLDRRWETRAGEAVTMSILLRPKRELIDWSWISMLAGLAVFRAISKWVSPVSLKWPNDVLVGELKIAGILSEVSGDAVVVGIGLNVNQIELPIDTATSLRKLTGHEFDRNLVAGSILQEFALLYQGWLVEVAEVQTAYREACSTIGQIVQVKIADRTVIGVATAVDDFGRIVVNGEPFSAGDVVQLQPDHVGK